MENHGRNPLRKFQNFTYALIFNIILQGVLTELFVQQHFRSRREVGENCKQNFHPIQYLIHHLACRLEDSRIPMPFRLMNLIHPIPLPLSCAPYACTHSIYWIHLLIWLRTTPMTPMIIWFVVRHWLVWPIHCRRKMISPHTICNHPLIRSCGVTNFPSNGAIYLYAVQ